MSFFDDDEPTRRRSQPRRRGAVRSGAPSTDAQAVMVRRGVALAIAILLFVLLLFVVNACRSSARENGLKDYNSKVASIGRASETQVGRPFFQLFGARAASGAPADLQTSVSALRQEAETELDQAEKLDVPDAMAPAQRSLLIVLELRRDGLAFVADKVRVALGNEGDAADEATTAIAGQMQSFLASDVLYRARVQPLIKSALDEAEVTKQTIPGSQFLPNVEWLSPQVVAARLGGSGGGGTGDDSSTTPAPGLHGTGLTSVAVGDVKLAPGSPNRIPATGAPTFTVQFANQGENDEQDIRVDVSVKGGGGAAISGSDTVASVARSATATATVRLARTPPKDTAVTITVRVRKVPGEEKTDNNEQTYQALFTE